MEPDAEKDSSAEAEGKPLPLGCTMRLGFTKIAVPVQNQVPAFEL